VSRAGARIKAARGGTRLSELPMRHRCRSRGGRASVGYTLIGQVAERQAAEGWRDGLASSCAVESAEIAAVRNDGQILRQPTWITGRLATC
jgi:hypothetical protein